MRRVSSLFFIALFSLLMFTAARAQVTTGDILGTVTDPTGAPIPGARVTVTNTGTQVARTMSTSVDGNYVFNLLQPGAYSVTITATGFKTFTASDIQLSAGSRHRVDAKLVVGVVTQKVTVKAQASALQTDSSVVSSTITGTAVQNVPLNGRNYINLVQVQPGINQGAPGSLLSGSKIDDRRQVDAYSANGLDDNLNNNMIDGADNNDRAVGAPEVRPSINAIAEVNVQTSNYPADVGRTGGAVVNIITKSGTNQFHGDLFEYLRNDITDAYPYNFGAVLPKAKLRWNQFGGSLGGPVIRNKTFFFGDYEGFRLRQGFPAQVFTVPTLYEEQHPGDFSDIGGPVICSSPGVPVGCTGSIDPIALKYWKMYPAPNHGINKFLGAGNETQNSNDFDAKVDQHFNDSNSMFARFIYNKVYTATPGALPEVTIDGLTFNPSPNSPYSRGIGNYLDYNAMLNYLHIFSPNLLLNLTASYTRSDHTNHPTSLGLSPNEKFGQPNVNTPIGDATTLAEIYVIGGSGLGSSFAQPLRDLINSFQYMGSVSYTHGNHNLKMGASLIRRQFVTLQSGQPEGHWNFIGYPNMIQGLYQSNERSLQLVLPHLGTWEIGTYFQDDWRVKRHTTLNLGLRYDVYTPYSEAHDQIANFDLATGALLIAGQNDVSSTAGVNTDYRGVEPRIGAAFDLGHGLVIRGGYGITFFPMNYASPSQMKNPPFVATLSSCGVAPAAPVKCAGVTRFADGFFLPPQPTTLNTPGVTIPEGTDPNFRTAYAQQFNLTVQKQFAGNVLTVTYIGELGRDMLQVLDLNTPPPNTASNIQPLRPYYSVDPLLGIVSTQTSGGLLNYNALQVSVDRRFSKGLAFQINYTFAHSLDTLPIIGSPASGDNGLGMVPSKVNTLDYGNSDLDVRHDISGTVNYSLPFGATAKGIERAAINGWHANFIGTWQTSVPFTILNATNISQTSSGNPDRPDIIGSPNLSHPSLNAYFNTGAFVSQSRGTLGSLGRNTMFGPDYSHLDVSIYKTFRLTERLNLNFNAEVFNIFNTTAFAAPNSTLPASGSLPLADINNPKLNTTQFGQVTSLLPSYTPRVFQFALTLAF